MCRLDQKAARLCSGKQMRGDVNPPHPAEITQQSEDQTPDLEQKTKVKVKRFKFSRSGLWEQIVPLHRGDNSSVNILFPSKITELIKHIVSIHLRVRLFIPRVGSRCIFTPQVSCHVVVDSLTPPTHIHLRTVPLSLNFARTPSSNVKHVSPLFPFSVVCL